MVQKLILWRYAIVLSEKNWLKFCEIISSNFIFQFSFLKQQFVMDAYSCTHGMGSVLPKIKKNLDSFLSL